MHGVVSLLPPPLYRQVETIWSALGQELDVRGVMNTPYPHFSYHVAEHYDLALIKPILQKFARETAPFTVQTTGLGVFTGALQPVIYINVVRNPRLTAVQSALWPLLESSSAGIVEYYHPEQWVPHITLAHGDVQPEKVPEVMALLLHHELIWEFTVDNLTLLYADDSAQQDEVKVQFPLLGK